MGNTNLELVSGCEGILVNLQALYSPAMLGSDKTFQKQMVRFYSSSMISSKPKVWVADFVSPLAPTDFLVYAKALRSVGGILAHFS